MGLFPLVSLYKVVLHLTSYSIELTENGFPFLSFLWSLFRRNVKFAPFELLKARFWVDTPFCIFSIAFALCYLYISMEITWSYNESFVLCFLLPVLLHLAQDHYSSAYYCQLLDRNFIRMLFNSLWRCDQRDNVLICLWSATFVSHWAFYGSWLILRHLAECKCVHILIALWLSP